MAELEALSTVELEETLERERKTNEVLKMEMRELETILEELEDQLISGGDGQMPQVKPLTDDEWKTRYTCQIELKKMLLERVATLNQKVDFAKKEVKELKLTKSKKNLKESQVVTNEMKDLIGFKLRNLELRLEQEMKAFHKANEERKLVSSELLQLRNIADTKLPSGTFRVFG